MFLPALSAAIEKITGKKYGYSDSKARYCFPCDCRSYPCYWLYHCRWTVAFQYRAGYVIRRILRRAVRYYYSYLDYKQPLLHQLMPVLAEQFENVFPELHKQIDFVSKVVKEEEEAFLRTLEKGLKKIDEIITDTTAEYKHHQRHSCF